MSSDSEEEDFILYGTPLEPLNEDEIPKKRPLTVEDQVAKDKHGRRRFHGAFTGGFSAGFFNTVGSLEGWKPTQFTSSRSARSKSHQQSAEDFMDDEDVDEFGIAPKTLQPRIDYNRGNENTNRKRSLMQFSEGPIPGVPVLKTLLEPVRETIGMKLLMKMGWKSGQGVGPRLSKSEKSASKKGLKAVRIYGCSLPPNQVQQPNVTSGDTSEEEEDETLEGVTFAPDDYEPHVVKPKDNCFGLGYSGLNRKPVLSSHVNLFEPSGPSLVMEEKKKKVSIRGQAFGVGAFENDDEDIYAKEDMSQYDFALDTPKMMAEKRQQERNSRLSLPSPSSQVLEGFLMASQPVVQKTYPPPLLPQGFCPKHQTKLSRFSSVPEGSPAVQPTRLTANERAVLVNTDCPQRDIPSSKENVVADPDEPMQVEKSTSTFKPFVADPEKQSRYEQYLTLSKLGQLDKLKGLQPITMTEWEAEREKTEFEQAARLYRPLSAAFSDRFVSASQPDEATDLLAPVARTVGANQDVVEAAKMKMFGRLTRRVGEWQPHSTLCKRFNIPPPGRSNSSMPTKTQRPKFSIFNFLDAASFNAPASTVSSDVVATSTPVAGTPKPAPSSVHPKEEHNTQKTATGLDEDVEKLAESTNKMDLYKAIFLSSSDESDGDDEKQNSSQMSSESNIQKNNSPPRGIFSNIETLNSLPKASSAENLEKTAKEINVLRNTSPPRGIFANLDSINTQYENSHLPSSNLSTGEDLPKSISQNSTSTVDNNKKENNNSSEIISRSKIDCELTKESQENNCSVYGPSLPQVSTQPQFRAKCYRKESSSESDEWVEKDGHSDSSDSSGKSHRHHASKKKYSKKSHRKSKKHKEKKHKHKKKKSK